MKDRLMLVIYWSGILITVVAIILMVEGLINFLLDRWKIMNIAWLLLAFPTAWIIRRIVTGNKSLWP
jgi:membrane protein implicated in regulation of membrane protease activity